MHSMRGSREWSVFEPPSRPSPVLGELAPFQPLPPGAIAMLNREKNSPYLPVMHSAFRNTSWAEGGEERERHVAIRNKHTWLQEVRKIIRSGRVREEYTESGLGESATLYDFTRLAARSGSPVSLFNVSSYRYLLSIFPIFRIDNANILHNRRVLSEQ